MTKPVLTVDEVAELLQCTPATVRERAAELLGVKFGRDWVFPAATLYDALARIAVEEAAKRRTPAAVTKTKRAKAPPRLPSAA